MDRKFVGIMLLCYVLWAIKVVYTDYQTISP